MPLITGARLGPYEITGFLGAGGMGEVYSAHDSRLRREVAVKVLPSFASADPDRAVQISVEGGGAPDWAPGGRELYYVAPDNRLMSVPIISASDGFKTGVPVALFRIDTTGAPGAVLTVSDDRVYAPFGDGRFLVSETRAGMRRPALNLLINWAHP